MSSVLAHYGIKGMRWGVRRYQNPDGSLTERGKKRVRKEYKREVDKARADVLSRNTKRQVDAYNEAADRMNKGGIDRFNKQQEKKYGKDFANREAISTTTRSSLTKYTHRFITSPFTRLTKETNIFNVRWS